MTRRSADTPAFLFCKSQNGGEDRSSPPSSIDAVLTPFRDFAPLRDHAPLRDFASLRDLALLRDFALSRFWRRFRLLPRIPPGRQLQYSTDKRLVLQPPLFRRARELRFLLEVAV